MEEEKKIPTLSSQVRDEPNELGYQKKSSNSFVRFLSISVIVLLVVFIIYAWKNPTSNKDFLRKEIATLEQDVKTLTNVLQVLEKKNIQELEEFKAVTNTKIKSLEDALKSVDLSKENLTTGISKDLNDKDLNDKDAIKIEQKKDELNQKNEQASLKKLHTEIIDAIEQQKSFASILHTLDTLALSPEFLMLIEPLRNMAPAKIRTKEQLIDDFDKVQEQVLQITPKNTDPAQSILDRVKDNIKITKGKSDRVQIKDAFQLTEIHLDQEDFEGAIKTLKPFDNKLDIKLWIKHVEDRLAYDTLLEKIKAFNGPF